MRRKFTHMFQEYGSWEESRARLGRGSHAKTAWETLNKSKKVFKFDLELSRLRRTKRKFCNGEQKQNTMSEQVLKIFGHGQNCQN